VRWRPPARPGAGLLDVDADNGGGHAIDRAHDRIREGVEKMIHGHHFL
jgi:hypothetical protein